MNSFARRVLPVEDKQPFEKMVLSFHPERSQSKVKFLIDQAECPVSNPPPMTMIINIPERVLLIKVAKMSDLRGDTAGYTLVFYDITDAVSRDEPGAQRPDAKRQLQKIPTVSGNRIVLVDVDSVFYFRAEGHYTWVHTAQGSSFCNLTIGDLESRLDSASFLRIHRSYLANLDHAEQIVRDDGRVTLKWRHDDAALPVARTSVPRLLRAAGLERSSLKPGVARARDAGFPSLNGPPNGPPQFMLRARRLVQVRCVSCNRLWIRPLCALSSLPSRRQAATSIEETNAMIPPAFDYHAPRSVADAIKLLGDLGPDAKLLAGGHSLLPMMKLRFAQPSHLIDLGKIAGPARHRAGRQRDPHRRDDHRARAAELQAAGRQGAAAGRGRGLDRRPAGALQGHDRRRHLARRPGQRPSGADAGAGRLVRAEGAEGRARGQGRRLLPRPVRDAARSPTRS